MKKGRWSSWFSNDLPDYILIILSVIFLLSAVVNTLRLYEHAKAHNLTIEIWWWLKRMMRIIVPLIFALWLSLSWYKDQLQKKMETIEHAKHMRRLVNIVWWITILILVLVAAEVSIVFYSNTGKTVFNLIRLSLMVILLVYGLTTSREEWRYFRKQPLCNIAAAYLLEKHNKFLPDHDFDKAHDVLLKACETAPEGTELWCRLAHFCELFHNDTTEADKYMAKAKELISTKKANSASDRACYFNYLGAILYGRGECEKGLEYMKQSIDIEPREGRISIYEEKLLEFKAKQQNGQVKQS